MDGCQDKEVSRSKRCQRPIQGVPTQSPHDRLESLGMCMCMCRMCPCFVRVVSRAEGERRPAPRANDTHAVRFVQRAGRSPPDACKLSVDGMGRLLLVDRLEHLRAHREPAQRFPVPLPRSSAHPPAPERARGASCTSAARGARSRGRSAARQHAQSQSNAPFKTQHSTNRLQAKGEKGRGKGGKTHKLGGG